MIQTTHRIVHYLTEMNVHNLTTEVEITELAAHNMMPSHVLPHSAD